MKRTLPLCLAVFVSSHLLAQESESSESDHAEAETIELSPFTVAADDSTGYVASESVSGTRIRALVKDLPFNVSVVTNEFIKDFDKFELADALAFTSSVSANDITPSAVNLRGFSASSPTRNGMSFFGLSTRSNTDRVEIIKGPYAAIYGKTLPGGLVNIITKRPQPKAGGEVNLTVGTLDYLRTEFSSTGPITEDKKLLYRVDVGYNEKGGSQDFADSSRQEYSAAVSYQMSENTSALVELSKMDNYSAKRSPVINIRDFGTYQYVGKLTDRFYFNRSGPSSPDGVHQDWVTKNIYGYLDHRFNDIFSLRVSGVWWERGSPALTIGGASNVFVTNLGRIGGRNVFMTDIERDNLQLLADLVAEFKTGDIAHKALISVSSSSETESTWTRAVPNSVRNDPAQFTRNLLLDDPVWVVPAFGDFEAFSNLTRDRSQLIDTEAVFVSERMDLMDSKLKVFLGGRYDKITSTLTDNRTALKTKTTSTAFTPQYGANFAINPTLSVYANYSQSYLPQSQVRTTTQELYPNEEGHGIDFGLKAALLENKLNVVFGAYSIARTNVLQTFFDEDLQLLVTDLAGEIKTDGLELDFNWQVNKSLQLIGGVGVMDNRVTVSDNQPWIVGKLVARGPSPLNYGLAAVYRFRDSALEGLSLRADFSGQGESLGEYGSGPYTRNGVSYENDGRANIVQPGYTIVNAGASYSWKTNNNRWRQSVSVNFKNIFDEQYTRGNWIPQDGFSTSITFKVKY